MKEEWRDIKEFEGYYQISNLGRVRSLSRKVKSKWGYVLRQGKIRAIDFDNFGYPTCRLSKNGKHKNKRIHVLICEAFLGGKKPNEEVNHIDGNKANSILSNLELVTRSGNIKHAYKLGLRKPKYGEQNHLSKLTEKQVLDIFSQRDSSIAKVLSEKYCVSTDTIYDIWSGTKWAHLTKAIKINRIRKGEQHCCAKITEKEVIQIRKLSISMSKRELADKFNITYDHVRQILSYYTWKHVA